MISAVERTAVGGPSFLSGEGGETNRGWMRDVSSRRLKSFTA